MKGSKKMGLYVVAAILLMALAFYQIELIFWEMPGKNANLSGSNTEPDEQANLLRPTHLYVTLGGSDEGVYGRISWRDESFEATFESVYELAAYILTEGPIEPWDWDALPWRKPACVMVYEFSMGRDLLKGQLGKLADNKEIAEIDGSWSELWVVPAQRADEEAQVFLVDSMGKSCARAAVPAWRLEANQAMRNMLLERGLQTETTYVASDHGFEDYFAVNSYVLEQTKHEIAYEMTTRSAFAEEGEEGRARMDRYALRFFEYPDTVSVREEGNAVSYSNEKLTIKLDINGRMQYVETLTSEEKEMISMREAYQLAAGFVRDDMRRSEVSGFGIQFADYEITEEGQYTFYFQYTMGGFPFRMEEELVDRWHMPYPVRVTVEGSKVRRYERYVLDLVVEDMESYTLESTWLDAVAEFTMTGVQIDGAPRLIYTLWQDQLVLQWEATTKEGQVRIAAS